MNYKEWLKEGLCVTCVHKSICKKIQPGMVIYNCKKYKIKCR